MNRGVRWHGPHSTASVLDVWRTTTAKSDMIVHTYVCWQSNATYIIKFLRIIVTFVLYLYISATHVTALKGGKAAPHTRVWYAFFQANKDSIASARHIQKIR